MTDDGYRECEAEVRECPVAPEDRHFDTLESAQDAFRERMEKEYGTIQSATSKSRDLPRAKPDYPDRNISINPPTVPYDPNSKYAVLSDVDGTLTRGSLVLDHAVYLHAKGIMDLGDLPEKWKKDPKNEETISELADNYRRNLAGLSETEIDVAGFVEGYVKDEGRFYSTMKQLQTFRKRGWEIQLISGSPDFLIKPFAAHFGFFGVGSNYHKDEGGKFNSKIDGMFGADAKREYLNKLDVDRFERVMAFGDTVSDKPLFDSAHHTTLVDPTEETSATLPASITIRD